MIDHFDYPEDLQPGDASAASMSALIEIQRIVMEMLDIYAVKFTDSISREVAIQTWARQLAAARADAEKERQ